MDSLGTEPIGAQIAARVTRDDITMSLASNVNMYSRV